MQCDSTFLKQALSRELPFGVFHPASQEEDLGFLLFRIPLQGHFVFQDS